jgi:hypothetical protein
MIALDYGDAGLLFPAISLLMLAYTNRFLGLAAVARGLVHQYKTTPSTHLTKQMLNLRQRLVLLRHTQAIGVMSLASCTACLLCVLLDQATAAAWLFGTALLLMLGSLITSLAEIYLSVHAIQVELDHLQPLDPVIDSQTRSSS